MVAYKQLCISCKKNYVLMKGRRQRPVCIDCEMKYLFEEPVTDAKLKKLFDIPKEMYLDSYFLRDVRRKYNMLGFITERQEEAFKNTVKELKDPKKREEWLKKQEEKSSKKKKKEKAILTDEERRMLGLEVSPKAYK